MTLKQHNRNMIQNHLNKIMMTPSQKSIKVIEEAMASGKWSIELGMSQIAAIKSLEK